MIFTDFLYDFHDSSLLGFKMESNSRLILTVLLDKIKYPSDQLFKIIFSGIQSENHTEFFNSLQEGLRIDCIEYDTNRISKSNDIHVRVDVDYCIPITIHCKKINVISTDGFQILLDRKNDFWESMEIVCVKECCGVDAFDFSEETILKSMKNYDAKEIMDYLSELIIHVSSIRDGHIPFHNEYLKREELIDLFKNIQKKIKKNYTT